ncbi:hypothetical protein C8J57DRAFT_1238715 [Mycena rebaudengoi]|nr:hypothetical protein C8J57DRAFT_1238715 [Mycena rebaudengoi]
MFPIWYILALLWRALLEHCRLVTSLGALHVLNVPPIAPPSVSRRLDPALWSKFWGNSSHPNHFSMQLLTNIAERTGVYRSSAPEVSLRTAIFDAAAGDPKCTINETSGAIFRG